jgi:hypothetical protein
MLLYIILLKKTSFYAPLPPTPTESPLLKKERDHKERIFLKISMQLYSSRTQVISQERPVYRFQIALF